MVLTPLRLYYPETPWASVQVPPPVKATSEYIDFLLAVASDPHSSVAQVLASMVPCMRLYAFLGKVIYSVQIFSR